MRLSSVQVVNFKSVDDSGAFAIAPTTCLVGKNEAGKTALLQALYKVNPAVAADAEYRTLTEYPRRRTAEYRGWLAQSGQPHDSVISVWDLDGSDLDHLSATLGYDPLTSDQVVLRRGYYPDYQWAFEMDERPLVTEMLAGSGLDEADRQRYVDVSTVHDLISQLEAREGASEAEQAWTTALLQRFPLRDLRLHVSQQLKSVLPRLVYFDQYYQLPGKISVEQLIASRDQGNPSSSDRVFLALLAIAGLRPEDLQSVANSEELIAQLEAASASISDKIFSYWSQNRHLKVRFDLHQGRPEDEPPFNKGVVFEVRIENLRHRASLNLEQRSNGFMWFFSFLVWFWQAQNNYGGNLILLLDEPGLGLHAKAQQDLLRYIREELEPKHQVVYTTHSPFMVDPERLLSVRTVEDVVKTDGGIDTLLGTKVSAEALSTDQDTLFPLQGALGYEITQSLFIGKNSLLVEGPSDLLYLRWFSRRLKEQGRRHLDPSWTIVPVGGISKVYPFMALFGGNKLNVAVLVDVAKGGKSEVERLKGADLLKDSRIFAANMYTDTAEADIEDMVGFSTYIALVGSCIKLPKGCNLSHIVQADPPGRVLPLVEEYLNLKLPATAEAFDHFTPAEYLTENTADLLQHLPDLDAALDRFERFFSDLNSCLQPGS